LKDKCDQNNKTGTVCLKKPGSDDAGGNKALITVLAVIGSLLFFALVGLGIMYYRRHKQMEALRRELAESTASQRGANESQQLIPQTDNVQ
jgi:hypothetical protein